MKSNNTTFLKLTVLTLLTALIFNVSLCTIAQTSSAHRKSSNAYRNNYMRVSASSTSESTYEIRDNGTLWAWGKNNKGQLGNNSLVNSTLPTQVDNDNDWVNVTPGNDYALAIKANGTLWGWGNNENGELGNGAYENKIFPTQIGTENNWVSVSTAATRTFALKSDGTLWSWGENYYSNGIRLGFKLPQKVGYDNSWISIAAGFVHSSAIKSDGTLWELTRSNDYTIATVQKGTDNDWVRVSTSGYNTLGIKSNGTIWTWCNPCTQNSSEENSTPTQINTDDNWVSISVGSSHSIALKSDGTIWTWGSNWMGQLGNGTLENKKKPTRVGSNNNWVSVIAGANCTFGVQCDGTLWAWGENNNGQLGDGTTENKTLPTQVSYTSAGVLSAAFSDMYTASIKTNGTLWVWGLQSYGPFGINNFSYSASPIRVGAEKNWLCIVVGSSHTIAIKSNGTLWAWGYNGLGQLGDGTFNTRSEPIQIGSDDNWVSIAIGDENTFAIKSNGTLWSCGFYSLGYVSYNTTNNVLKQVGTDTNWVSVSAGDSGNSVGLKSDGTIWSWGENFNGELGDGTNIERPTPVKVGIDNNWILVASGDYHTLGLKSNGTMWAWGENKFGQLGNKTNISRNTPTQIGIDINWISLSPVKRRNSAIKSDGSIWLWGSNADGYLGDGTSSDKFEPTKIQNVTNVISLPLLYHADRFGLIKANRTTLCSMGENISGQLGDGTTNNRNTFDCITFGHTVLPLQIVSYNIKLNNKTIVNTWQTANEINVKNINVQRSINGINFITIGTVNAKGGSTYSFQDVELPAKTNTLYYRLQIVDTDGSVNTSNVLFIKLNINTTGSLSIFPNPAIGKQFTVKLHQLPKAIYQLSLTNSSSVTLNKLNFNYDGTVLFKTINAELPSGVYILTLQSNIYTETQKIVID